MATADELNMLRQQMQETIAAQANAMQELQRQLNESQQRLAQSEAARSRDVSEILATQNAFISRLSENFPMHTSRSDVSLVDTRGIAKPSSFQSDRKVWPIWSFRMSNFLEGAVTGFTKILEWSADEIDTIDDDTESDDISALKDLLNNSLSTEKLHALSHQLYSVLAQLTDGESNDIVRNVANSNGFETWRVLSKQYDPAGSGRKRTVLSSILRPGEYDLHDLKSAISRWETKIRLGDLTLSIVY